MLIYVIPLVILIIVLIVFKKRQDAQESDKAKTKTVKAKKTGSASKAAPQRTKVVEPVGVTKKSATPLSADTRKKIEGLIQERNFFAAEAQINQALNRDNSQHELYLLLLDIHILQQDDFAITQLINHIRTLKIDEVLSQAEEKRSAYEGEKSVKPDPVSKSVVPASNTSDFDELSLTSLPVDKKAGLAFEQLQQESAPVKEEPAPLEFNFKPSAAPASTTATKTEPEQDNSFDFNPKSSFTQSVPTESAPSVVNEVQFDFESFKVEPTTSEISSVASDRLETDSENKTNLNQIPDLDLDLNLSTNNEQLPASDEEIKPLDFSFSLDTPVPAAEKTAVPATEFDPSSLTAAAPVAEPASQTNLSGMDFKLDHLETTPEAPAATAMSFDLPATPAQTAINQHDPLVQSFPELLDVNEASLNLDLAQQYIQLGASAAAREIIAEREAEYTPEQQQRAEQLLNQIAS
ncbi:fimbrial protein FimV [Acinetobacter sp. AR2-3]|uniref:fimbrial protein FimV n=1 Tax=Acinetobacter sp. AR2-3 TaxID=1891969 RepID=UPI000900385A|nr:fimbrial protein FimV [Acinetobacter sp. AR2-3]OIU79318.1 fimbrial protein FimV [Acinetobacter sp. AR2-3]